MAYEKAKVFLFMGQKVLKTDASQSRAAGLLHSHLKTAGHLMLEQYLDRGWSSVTGTHWTLQIVLSGRQENDTRAPQEATSSEHSGLPTWYAYVLPLWTLWSHQDNPLQTLLPPFWKPALPLKTP